MLTLALGLVLGAAFGALLQLSGASSHTKIVNALRLKDLTIMKLILMAIGVGLMGVHLLDLFGLANMKVKELYLLGIILAGMIFGVGFALSGYCPGTALAACAEGKPDAWVTVMGGLGGALVFAFMFPEVEESSAVHRSIWSGDDSGPTRDSRHLDRGASGNRLYLACDAIA